MSIKNQCIYPDCESARIPGVKFCVDHSQAKRKRLPNELTKVSKVAPKRAKKTTRNDWTARVEKFLAGKTNKKTFTMGSPGSAQVTAVRLKSIRHYGLAVRTEGCVIILEKKS